MEQSHWGAAGAMIESQPKCSIPNFALTGKLRPLRPEQGPAQAVADGEAEIGLTQISEILPYAGAELVGPLPSEVQLTTTYVTAIGARTSHADAAAALIKCSEPKASIPPAKRPSTRPNAGLMPVKRWQLRMGAGWLNGVHG
jgi:hypothetical protein